VLAALLLCCSIQAKSQSVPEQAERIQDLAFLIDQEGLETIESVSAAGPDRFVPWHGNGFTNGYSKGSIWLRFRMNVPIGDWILDILPPFLNDLRLYVPAGSGGNQFEETRMGNLFPFLDRQIPYRGFAVHVLKPDDLPGYCYLRVETRSSFLVVLRIWSESEFNHMATVEAALLAASLAVLLTLLLINFINWLWMKESLLLWYVWYTLCLSLTTLNNVSGFFSEYVAPDYPFISDVMVRILAMLVISSGIGFQRLLLGISIKSKSLDYFYKIGIWSPLVLLPLAFSSWYRFSMPTLLNIALIVNTTNLWMAYNLLRQRQVGSEMVFIANLVSLCGGLMMILNLLGVINGGLSALYSMQIAALGAAISLHLALGARFRALREERRMALANVEYERMAREDQGRFIDLISHEYRTPLSVIQTQLDILDFSNNQSVLGIASAMRTAVRRLREVMESAQYGESREGSRPLILTSVNLMNVLSTVITEVQTSTGSFPFRISGPKRSSVNIYADSFILKTILANLIENALKYSPSNSIISIELSKDGDTVLIAIENDCDLITESAEDLMKRGKRGSNGIHNSGIGMGLFLAERLSSDMKASIDINISHPNRFKVLLRFLAVE
jgi:signal transduction histidine kinase